MIRAPSQNSTTFCVTGNYCVELHEFFDVLEVVAQVGDFFLQLEDPHDVAVVQVVFDEHGRRRLGLGLFGCLFVFFAERKHQQ